MQKRNSVIVGAVLAAALLAAVFVMAFSNAGPYLSAQSLDRPVESGSMALPFGPQTFRDMARAQMPMVVNIRTESRRQTRDLSQFFGGNDLFDRFFGFPRVPPQPRDQITKGAGSGFIIDHSGLILTNNHVVESATAITVALYAEEEGREYDARVVGRDPLTDSALIELIEKPSQQLPVATLGRSNAMKPGDWVMAIGNPFNLAHTVTVGVISAIERPYPVAEGRWQRVLQTDAAINPGNSGGPLLNLQGEVIGINTAMVTSEAAPRNVGVGFAIPIDAVRDLLPELRKGTVTRGRLGVQITPVTKDLAEPLGLDRARGAVVRVVERPGPAAAAGIEPGDVITRYDERTVDESNQLVDMVARTKPGTTVPVEIVRDGERRTVEVTVARLELPNGEGRSTLSVETEFGLSLRDLTPAVSKRLELPAGRSGAVVTGLDPGGPAAAGGIRAGDVILEVERMAVGSATEADNRLRRVPAGGTAFVLLWRVDREVFVTMTRERGR